MTTVRKLDLTIGPDTYPAIERTLIDSVASGDAPPTVMQWTFEDDLFLELGPVEDASLIDRDRAEEEGIAYGRRFNVSGGTGFFQGDNTPVLYMFFRDRGDRTMTEYIDLAGEAMAKSLRDAGVSDAVYRAGGDIELEPEEEGGQYAKVGVSGAGYQNGVWGVFMNLINKTFDPETFGLIDEVLKLPEEKFEDKETDSAAGRMTSLSDVAPDTDVDAIMAEGAANLAAMVDGTVEEGELSADERAALEEHREYYGSAEWFERYSTSRVFEDASPDDRVAEVAYKGRKLIKTSVLVDPDDTIVDVEFTGDMFHKPAFEAIDRINEAVVGESIADEDALLAAIEAVYEAEDFEMPWLPPEDFLQPLVRARENLGPVAAFGRE
jgi:lipoate-protein ligase A